MEISGVQGQNQEPIRQGESSKERQEIFELQWEINLIGAYLAASEKNGNFTHKLNSLKKNLESGQSPEELVPLMNQLINQINGELPITAAPFPPFDLTTKGDEPKALAQFAISLEKYLNTTAEKNKLSWDTETLLFNHTRTLIDQIGAIPIGQAIDRLNEIIHMANQLLPPMYHLKTL